MTLPADLASDEAKTIYFFRDEVEAAEEATAALLGDLRFEHLDHAENKVRRFMAECWADRSTNHVPLFVANHAAQVTKATCYIPVEFLSVASVREFPGVRLLPVDDPQIPRPTAGFSLEKPTGCVAAVEVEGTSLAKMADRARDRVRFLLRAVRIAESGRVHDFQLRFRIGIGYAFDERLQGWNRRSDDAYELPLTEQGVKELFLRNQPRASRDDQHVIAQCGSVREQHSVVLKVDTLDSTAVEPDTCPQLAPPRADKRLGAGQPERHEQQARLIQVLVSASTTTISACARSR
jgi:hypothetical protein